MVLLAGCAAPMLRQEVAPIAPAALGLTGASTPVADHDWWRSFGDPQLDRLVDEAIAGAPGLAAALARLSQAQAVLGQRRAEDGPQAALQTQLQAARLSGRYTVAPPFGGSVRTVGTVGVDLGYTLYLFGRQRLAIDGASASSKAAGLDLAAARLAIASAVTQTYLDLARAEAQATIARRTIATRQGASRLIRAQLRNHLASKVELTAADTLVAEAQAALTRAAGGRALAANALAALAGRGPDRAAAIEPAALRLDNGLQPPAQLPADLLGRRADVAAALARIEAAQAGRKLARRAWFPNINLGALIGLQAIGLGNLLSLDAAQLGVGPALSLPLFDNGRRRADLAGATAGVDLATATYNEAVVGAVREAADALALVRNLGQQQRDVRAVVRGLAETARLNAVRVRAGLESKLGVVETDTRLLDAELAQVNLAADATRARVQLLVALGGGWEMGR
jgi:NodT family efflux transporter outer membrane factor (OMF) lipoprotein